MSWAKTIFLNAAEIAEEADRRVYLDRECGDDESLRQEVEDLLRHHGGLGSFLETSSLMGTATITAQANARRSKDVGPYKLVELIGEGGMGEVWMAQQSEPIERLVALKFVKLGMDSRSVLARFEAERQALALMDHPNIARVLDAGVTADGHPYFVMELVKGTPITHYCDRCRLSLRQRLELFVSVCQAIQHAHQKGIIHRDIKPSNVLVALYDDRPVPKVIDFGVAKATGRQLTQKTLHTGFGAIVGTLEYVSPEQASFNQLDVDTRSDVYSLGVLLYELLTGSPPFRCSEVAEADMLEMLRLIREQEPSRPSAKLSTAEGLASLAANRGTEPQRLAALVRGELDWIVMKALDKDRGQRYESVSAFAADVQRSLNDEPVQACQPSAGYRFRKFARRNKRTLATATLLGVMLLVTVGAVVASALWATVGAKARLEVEAAAKKELERNLYFTYVALAERELSANNWGRAVELLDECPVHLRGWEWHYLKRLRHAPPVTLRLGERFAMGSGYDLAFSPDGRRVAAPVSGNAIKVWDAATGRELLTLTGHTGPVRRLAFGGDGGRLASASDDRTVKVWDVAPDRRGQITEPLVTLDGHKDRITGVAFSPDGLLLASASQDQTVKVWDVATGKERLELPGLFIRNRLVQLAFSPDGHRLACGSKDNVVKVWEVATGKEFFSLGGHTEPVFSVIFSHDGKRLASVSWDNLVKVWDLTTGKEAFSFRGHANGVWGAAFSPDGRRLAVGGGMSDGLVKVYDLTTGEREFALYGHNERVISVAFSPDGTRLASAGFDRTVRLWELTTGQEVLALRGHTSLVGRVEFSPEDGRRLASVSQDGTLRVWNATPAEESPAAQAMTLRGHTGIVYRVAFSPDSQRLASGSRDSTVKVWEVVTGKGLLTLHHTEPVFSVAFNRDGTRIASGSYDRTVKLWDVRTGREALTLRQFKGFVGRVAFSPADERLATSDASQNVQVWDAKGHELVRPIRHEGFFVWDLAFSPDGKQLATAHADQTVKLWDSTNGQALRTMPGHGGPVLCVAFSPDGKMLASGSVDRTVKVWDVATGMPRTLKEHSDYVFSLAFSPDGKYLASASWGEVLIWDVETGDKVQTLGSHAGAVWSVAYSRDGKRLAAAGGYKGMGEIKIWDATLWTRTPAQP